jgi:hypothetical protein
MSTRVEHDYYGVPVWLMQDYLTQLGGHPLAEDVMEGIVCCVPRSQRTARLPTAAPLRKPM